MTLREKEITISQDLWIKDKLNLGNKFYKKQNVKEAVLQFQELLQLNYPIVVKKIKEDRFKFCEYTDSIGNKTENFTVYIMSDSSMKCGFLNNYKTIKENYHKNVYIFDEIDFMLNPMISELNFPDQEHPQEFKEFDKFYDLIYEVLYTIFITDKRTIDDELTSIIKKYPNAYTINPHFNVIDNTTPIIKDIKNYVKNKFTQKLKGRGVITENIDELLQKTDNDKNLLYMIYNFLNEPLESILTLINKKNYGTHSRTQELTINNTEIAETTETTCTKFAQTKSLEHGKDHGKDHGINIIVPFLYNDVPSINSQFTNPLLILGLTIIDYLLQKHNIFKLFN
jgi:hypothetical protein